jgi:hypothetical protein
MANDEHLAVINQGVKAWNAWREETPETRLALWSVDLSGADLHGRDLSGAALYRTNFRGADLSGADLSGSTVDNSDLSGADLSGATLVGTNVADANLVNLRWDSKKMRGRYQGIRGLDSCFGNALFKRAAADQDFLDALEAKWSGTWRIALLWAWHALDYGRSLSRIAVIGFGIAALFGFVFKQWPGFLDYTSSANTWFTPFYFSVVTFTTLGFGDVKPKTIGGEFLVSFEVIFGYITLGLLLAVLAEKLARRS